MKVTDSVFSDYNIEYISFVESSFKRNIKIKIPSKSKLDVDIEVSKDVKKTKAICSLTLKLKVIDEENGKIAAEGIFTTIGGFRSNKANPKLSIEKFASMNAYALMYPFIREHLASISVKTGMNPILLPSVNFLALMGADLQTESLND